MHNPIVNQIKSRRNIIYHEDLVSDNLATPVYSNNEFDVYKLSIKERRVHTSLGEIDYLLRDKSNNLKYILLYCYIINPGKLYRFEYYINDTVLLPSKFNAKTDKLVDEEKAKFYAMDFIINYLEKKFTYF